MSSIIKATGISVIALDQGGQLIFPGKENLDIVPSDAVYAFRIPDKISRFITYL